MRKFLSHARALPPALALVLAVGCGHYDATSRTKSDEASTKNDPDSGDNLFSRKSSFVECSIARSRGVDPYKKAVIAAIHHFSTRGEVDDLVGLLERHPGLVDTRLVVAGRVPEPDDGYAPLHRAAEYGHFRTVEYLLERKADINGDAGGGWTPLHIAAKFDDVEVCRVLLEKGANANALTTPVPERTMGLPQAGSATSASATGYFPAEPARTPLDIAREKKRQNIVDLLLKYGKTGKVPGPGSDSPPRKASFVKEAMERSGGVDLYRKAVIGAIHYFAESGEVDDLVGLLEPHPDLVDARLVVASRKPKTDDSYAPIHRATHKEHRDVVEYLLERKADINGDGGQGMTPLRIAEQAGRLEMAHLLREKGAKKEVDPKTPIPDPGK
jgi:ankyrin